MKPMLLAESLERSRAEHAAVLARTKQLLRRIHDELERLDLALARCERFDQNRGIWRREG